MEDLSTASSSHLHKMEQTSVCKDCSVAMTTASLAGGTSDLISWQVEDKMHVYWSLISSSATYRTMIGLTATNKTVIFIYIYIHNLFLLHRQTITMGQYCSETLTLQMQQVSVISSLVTNEISQETSENYVYDKINCTLPFFTLPFITYLFVCFTKLSLLSLDKKNSSY